MRQPTLLSYCGLGFLVSGIATAGVPLRAPAPAAARSAHVQVTAGPSLVGQPSPLTIDLSLAGTSGPTAVAVTDLLPSGLRYVAGSARLDGVDGRSTPAEPRMVATSSGTRLVWPSLTLPSGAVDRPLRLTVEGAGPHPATATTGSVWTDRATLDVARAGTSAPLLSAAAAPVAPAADMVATAQGSARVVPVWAAETARVLAPAGSDKSAAGVQPLEERLVIRTSPDGRLSGATVRVYFPGTVTWRGCVGAVTCWHPTVTQLRLVVAADQPDRPQLPRLDPSPAAAPVGTTSADPATITPTAEPTRALFTVVTWQLGPRSAPVTAVDYRIDAAPTSPYRTQDTVTATATMPATSTAPSTPTSVESPGTVSPTTAARPATTVPSTTVPSTTVPSTTVRTITVPAITVPAITVPAITVRSTTVRSTTVRSTTVRSTTVRSTTVQAWPASMSATKSTPKANPTPRDTAAATKSTPPAATRSADVVAGSTPTTTTTVATSTADPFDSGGATTGSSTTTTVPGGATSAATTTTTTTTGPGGATSAATTTTAPGTGVLASTGADIERTFGAGLLLSGMGGLLLLTSRRSPRWPHDRRTRRRAGQPDGGR